MLSGKSMQIWLRQNCYICRRKGNNNVFNIDIVDSYHVSVKLYYNGKVKCAIDSIANKETRAVFGLRKTYKMTIWILKLTEIQLFTQSFDMYVKYGILKI